MNTDRKTTRVPAIVLAAGLSRRMGGRFKPLLDVGGRAMIRRVVVGLLEVDAVGPVIVVTGHRADEVAEAVGGLGVIDVSNPNYEAGGMVSSAKVGVSALPAGAPGFVLSLGDQPVVRAETISRLVDVRRTGAAAIAVPAYHGKRGHPVVMAMECARAILNLSADETLKTVVEGYKDRCVEVAVEDPGVTMDVDTPEDYERLRKYWDEHCGSSTGVPPV